MASELGTGNLLKLIWENRWLQSPISYAVQSSVRILDREAKVKELIDGNSIRPCKVHLIEEIFMEEEANSMHAFVVWLFVPTGNKIN